MLDGEQKPPRTRSRWPGRQGLLAGAGLLALALLLMSFSSLETAARWWLRAPTLSLRPLNHRADPLFFAAADRMGEPSNGSRLVAGKRWGAVNKIGSIAVDPSGDNLLAASAGGVWRVRLATLKAGSEGDCAELPRTAIEILGPEAGVPGLPLGAMLVEEGQVIVAGPAGVARMPLGGQGEAGRFEALGFGLPETASIVALARSAGVLYAGSAGDGLLRLMDGHWETVAGLGGSAHVEALAVSGGPGRQALLVASRRGLARLDGDQLRWLSKRWTTSLVRKRGGLAVWVLGPEGAERYVHDALEPFPQKAGLELLGLDCDADGCAGVTARSEGGGSQGAFPQGARRSVYLKAQGVRIWAGDEGMSLEDRAGHRHPLRLGGLPEADITAVVRQGPLLWLGLYEDGLLRIEGDKVQRLEAPGGVDALVGAPQGGVWAATHYGLLRFSEQGVLEERLGKDSGLVEDGWSGLARAPDGAVWAVGAKGVVKLSAHGNHSRTQSWTQDSGLPQAHLGCVVALRDGRILAGSLHGLLSFRPGEGWNLIPPGDGRLPDGWVTALTGDGQGGAWIGIYDAGLVHLSGGQFQRVGLHAGLKGTKAELANRVMPRAMLWAGKRLFIGTQGAGMLVLREGKLSRFSLESGLPNSVVTALAGDQDSLLIGTRAGVLEARVQGVDPLVMR